MKGKLARKWVIGIVLIGAGFAGILRFQERTERLLLTTAEPITHSANRTGEYIYRIARVVWQSPQQGEDIRMLRVENRVLKARLAELEYIQRENEKLRQALERETESSQFILARVQSRSPSLLDDYMILDVGLAEHITIGDPVLVDGFIQIGTIVQVTEKNATVQLLSHVGEKIEIYIPQADVSSVALGKGIGLMETQVPESITVQEGEPLFSTGPPDFIIGYVEQITRSEAGPFHIVRFNHPVSLTDIRTVFVLKKL